MDRVKIKEAAKAKIKGNIWNLLWPILVIGLLNSVVSSIFDGNSTNALVNLDLSNFDVNSAAESITTSASPMSFVIGIIFGVIEVAYLKYVLNFVRTGKFEFNDIIDCLKTKWLNILIVVLVARILMTLGIVLFIIPGVIIALGLAMSSLIVIDTDLSGIDAIKASWKMMKGYKWNYLIFVLSFLGWILLVIPTIGLLLIWLVPYIQVSEILYYEELKKVSEK